MRSANCSQSPELSWGSGSPDKVMHGQHRAGRGHSKPGLVAQDGRNLLTVNSLVKDPDLVGTYALIFMQYLQPVQLDDDATQATTSGCPMHVSCVQVHINMWLIWFFYTARQALCSFT